MPSRPALLVVALLSAGGVLWWWWPPRSEAPVEFAEPSVDGGWVKEVPGLWTLARRGEDEDDIGAIGYARGWEAAAGARGVTGHVAAAAQPGLNLYSSGHGPEAVLMAMDGQELHRWRLPYAQIEGAPPLDNHNQDTWRRVHLLEDGSLLGIYGGRGLVKVDRDSKLVWFFGERVHHDVDVDAQGVIRTLVRAENSLPDFRSGRKVIDDYVVELAPGGEVLSRLSVLECLLASQWAGLVRRLAGKGGDILHTNAISVLAGHVAGRVPGFATGNLLLCSRNLELVFVIDPRQRRVVWLSEGPWGYPHDPRELANGHLLLFDNLGNDGSSRVIEFDPLDGTILWQWGADPPTAFYSLFCGASARLANGNTLITETGAGRAFEVTPAGEVVWEFVSPHRAGRDDSLVAALFEMERLPEEGAPWLNR